MKDRKEENEKHREEVAVAAEFDLKVNSYFNDSPANHTPVTLSVDPLQMTRYELVEYNKGIKERFQKRATPIGISPIPMPSIDEQEMLHATKAPSRAVQQIVNLIGQRTTLEKLHNNYKKNSFFKEIFYRFLKFTGIFSLIMRIGKGSK
jgi:hypothetical protein